MRIGLIGRTHILIDAARQLLSEGHVITFAYTCKSETYYSAHPDDFQALAQELRIPYFCDMRINDRVDTLSALGTDVAVSINWPTLLKGPLLAAFPHGILNAHAGDLPRYKGNACPNWAILNFEKRVGLTIHKMTNELDSGPYLSKAFLDIDESTYVTDIYDWLSVITPPLFVKSVGQLTTTGFIDQNNTIRALRTFPRRSEDSRIHWDSPTRNVLAIIRASSHPFAGAFTFLEGSEEVHIFRAKPHVPDYDFSAMPGQLCLKWNGNPVVATKDGMIEVEESTMGDLGIDQTKARICASLRNRLT